MCDLACLVTGDRNATPDRWWLLLCNRFDWLLNYTTPGDRVIVLHGDARGIDSLADQYFTPLRDVGVTVERFPADWTTYGKGAGPRRNQQMLDRLLALQAEGYRAGVMAFHDSLGTSKGTGGMVRIARNASIPVLTFTSDWQPEGRPTGPNPGHTSGQSSNQSTA